MKEIRLNDKMWFGKYKGVRMKDVADRDRMFLDKLLLDNTDFEFAENLKSYLGKRKSFGDNGDRPIYNYGAVGRNPDENDPNPYDDVVSESRVQDDVGV